MHITVRGFSLAAAFLAVFTSTYMSVIHIASAEQLVWSTSQFNDEQNKGRLTSLLSFGVPETDIVQIRGTCAAGSSGNFSLLQVSAGFDGMVDGRSVFVTLSTSSFRQPYKGTTIGSQADFGITGVELVIDNDDALWEALRRDLQLNYNVFGSTKTVSLRGSSKPVDKFVNDCKFYAGKFGGSP